MELNIASISAIIGVFAVGGGCIFALGKLFERVNQLKERIDKLESVKNKDENVDALKILDEIYAKGNISTEEYQKRKKNLQAS